MEKFDCIIIGAGPSGIAAAYKLAKTGLKTIVLERGEIPGSKNMFGGILYSTVLNKLIPEFWKEAPVERHITKRKYSLLSKHSEIALNLRFDAFNNPPFNNSFTVLRAKFDRWFAKKAEESGAFIITEAVVDEIITEGERVKGVKIRAEDGVIYGDIVICAEGANSLLAEKAGMKKKPDPANMSLGVKEIISLPKGIIEDRFSLENGEGGAFEFFGEALGGITGSGFIYTNRDTLSVGIGCPVSILRDKKLKPNELIDSFKKHPSVKNLLRGGEIEEFSAHMIPEGWYSTPSKLIKDGLILTGDCAGLVNPSLYREGSNMAMASGVFAAETAADAKKKGNFSAEALNSYVKKLNNSFVFKDLKRYKDVPRILHSTPELFKEYPEGIIELLEGYFTISEKGKEEIHEDAKRLFRDRIPLWKFIVDAYKARRLFT